jgi:sigma-B regulation protein RsbU (phosphoserine phosphatase)
MVNRSLQQWIADFDNWLDYVPDAVVVVDCRGQVVLANSQAERMFQRSPRELAGLAIEALIPERFREAHLQHREKYKQTPHVRPMGRVMELTALRGDGSEFPVEISLGPIPASDEPAVFVVIRDLTERRRTEAVLREHEAQVLAARTIQQQMLPAHPPEIEGYDIAGVLRPAEIAGGDNFDFFQFPSGCLGVVVGDVAGQGLGPVQFMAAMHSRLRRLAETCCNLDEILQKTNAAVTSESAPPSFLTVFLGCLDTAARRWCYSSAGHTAGFVLDQQGNVRVEMAATSIPLAVLSGASFPVSDPIALHAGDMLLLPTNGILESRNGVGEPFGAPSCLRLVHEMRERPAREILERLLDTIARFTGNTTPTDDLTAVLIKVGER